MQAFSIRCSFPGACTLHVRAARHTLLWISDSFTLQFAQLVNQHYSFYLFQPRRSFAVFRSQPCCGLPLKEVVLWLILCGPWVRICPGSELVQGVKGSEFRLVFWRLMSLPSALWVVRGTLVWGEQMEERRSSLLGNDLKLACLSYIINTHLQPRISLQCHMAVFCRSSLTLLSDFVVSWVIFAVAKNKHLIAPLFSLS